MPVVFDLGTFDDAIAHPHEHLDDPTLHDRQRVHRPRPWAPSGQGHVEPVGLEQPRFVGGVEDGAALIEGRLKSVSHLVREHADGLALFMIE